MRSRVKGDVGYRWCHRCQETTIITTTSDEAKILYVCVQCEQPFTFANYRDSGAVVHRISHVLSGNAFEFKCGVVQLIDRFDASAETKDAATCFGCLAADA